VSLIENALLAESGSATASNVTPSAFAGDINYCLTNSPTAQSNYSTIVQDATQNLTTGYWTANAGIIANAFSPVADSNKALTGYYLAYYADKAGVAADASIPIIAGSLAATLSAGDLLADEGLLVADTAYPFYARNSSAPNLGAQLASVANQVAGLPGQTVAENAAIVNEMDSFSYYSSTFVITATEVEATTLTSPAGGAANAAGITGTFSSQSNVSARNLIPQVAGEAAAYLYGNSATSYAPAVAAAAVKVNAADASLVALSVIGQADPTISAGPTAANVVAITGSIASLAPSNSGLNDTVLLTLAQNVVGLSPALLDSGVAGAVADYYPHTQTGDNDRQTLTSKLSVQVTTGGNTQYADVALISATIAQSLQLGAGDTNLGADEAAVALQGANALNSVSQTSYIPSVAVQVAQVDSNLADQVQIAAGIANSSAYSALPVAVTTATEVEEVSLVQNGDTLTSASNSATAYSTAIPTAAPSLTQVAATGQTLTNAESIGIAVSIIPAVSSNVQSSGTFAESGLVAAAVALSQPYTTGSNFNYTLYNVAQVFGQHSGAGSNQIPLSNIQGIAIGLGQAALSKGSIVFALDGQQASQVNYDVIPAMASAITSQLGANPANASYIQTVLNELITAFPGDTADILGSVIATLPSTAGISAATLEGSAEHFIDNATLLAEVFPNFSLAMADAEANFYITQAYNFAEAGVNGGAKYGWYPGTAGLTPEETPFSDM
jgi:hypothetical protein